MSKLTEEQFNLLDKYIKLLVSMGVDEAFRQDTLSLSIKVDETRDELKKVLVYEFVTDVNRA